ncbi:asparagine synthase (glutamine-hydrolyzing) [Rhizobium lemnae]|uniref:asparagine synthase (glutamine-hydrolyzing) n=1 Tax=Rhizobium lemnae TaxID=1214924 RepID=A0ABV8EB70_9HYPH|nr:asparagine synthase (glutamine-hydrolyzing) [Rhizobium lemnae]MCJ8507154.1 asparagine synthase (glutamine-hydrolyzing) [Rhizobium lemnae]
MCGIAGWIDFSGHSADHPRILKAMTDSIYRRGPDGEGAWSDSIAAIGHRRLAIIDIEHGAQPMQSVDADGCRAVISFCGEIFNWQELRAELQTFGYHFETNSDTEVILKGFLHWGQDVVEHLNGMFAIAIWEPRRQTLLLLRDRLGVKPLFYYPTSTGVVFGSEPKALFQHPLVSPRVSRNGLCEILDMTKTPEMTPYVGMFELRPGGRAVFDRNGFRKDIYWQLQATHHTDDLERTIDTVRSLLSDTVRRQLVSDVPICTLLSGGLDSSAVTALAANVLGRQQLASFSVDFRHNLSNFSADGVRGAADAPFARELATHAATRHTELLLDSDEMLDETVRRNVLHAVDAPPAYWGDMWPSLYLLFRELSKHSVVALSGEAADEVFGGYQWFRNPAAIHGKTFPWLTAGSSRYFGGVQLLSQDLLNTLDRDTYRAERFQEALSEVPVLEGESDVDRSMRRVSYLALTRFLQTLLDRNDRMSMAVGVEVRVPFCDHRLVDYVFNVPWQMKTFDGREKSLLRAATRPYLPGSIADRIKTPYPATQDRAYENGLRKELAEVLSDGNAPVRNLIDCYKAKALLASEVSETSQPYNRGSLEMALWLNRWLTEYRVELAI